MERFNIQRAGEKSTRIKHKFTDNYGDTIDLYQFGNDIFIDGTFEGGKRPDFRAIFSVEIARKMAEILNDLADKIEDQAGRKLINDLVKGVNNASYR